MKLSECLNAADINTLRKIADYYDLTCSRHSKLALLQELLFLFRSQTFMAEQLNRWQTGRENAMLRLCLDQRSVFSVEELSGIFQTYGGEPAIEKAVPEGWLFPTTQFGGRLMYCIPEELHERLRGRIVAFFGEQLDTSDEGPLLYQEEGYAMVRDLDVFLQYVRHHAVRLTGEGSMYKRNLVQVLELLEVTEDPLESGWRFGYGRRFHDYPDRFALIYDYAYHTQLLEEDVDGLLKVTPVCETWNRLPELERQRAVVRFYITTYRRPIKRLPQIALLIARAATRWVDTEALLNALGDLVNDYYYDSREQVWKTRIMKMFMHLGLTRMGTDESSREWFQITKLGQQLLTPEALPISPDQTREKQRILIVQPNFEVVVTTDLPLVTAELALFTELKQAGVVRVYRLTEETVRQALQSGKTISTWLDFVQKYSQTPIPGNVERTLAEWERTYQTEQADHGDTLTS